MRSALGRLGIAAGVALLLLVGVLLAILPGRGEREEHSVFSTEPAGLRALFLLCEALGLHAEPWSQAPGDLDGHGALLFVTKVPEEPQGVAGTAPDLRRGRDLGHYRRFLDEGGTLFFAGVDGEELDFLRDELGLDGLDDLASEDHAFEDATVRLATGEPLDLARAPVRRISGAEAAAGDVLLRGAELSVLGLLRPAGAGRVALLALDADTFDNAALEEHPGHALLFVRLLERLAPVERVLFDEYALGGWTPASRLELAFSPRLAWLSVHLVLLACVLLWRSAWSAAFARDPAPLLAASPLFRAQGAGRVLARAGRWDVLARLLARGALERWDARAGLRVPQASGQAAMDPEALERNLRALARGDERLIARARELFLERRPADEHELARLDADLRALEAELFAPGARKTPRGLGAPAPRTAS